MLSIFSCAFWPFVCLLWRNVCVDLLPIFNCVDIFCYRVVWAVCIFGNSVLVSLIICKYFLPVRRLTFQFFYGFHLYSKAFVSFGPRKTDLPIFYTRFVQKNRIYKKSWIISGYYSPKMCTFKFCFWTDIFCLAVSFEITCFFPFFSYCLTRLTSENIDLIYIRECFACMFSSHSFVVSCLIFKVFNKLRQF